MGLFKKKCAYCGTLLDDFNTMERMGKKFCSEEHANDYWDYRQTTQNSHGGC
jgi:hypothetical protein